MTAVYFQQLPYQLSACLQQARTSIRIAVCWFSHRTLFDILIARLKAGVRVELILEYDTQNFREGGLDFQHFVENGGLLYRTRQAGLMHHKFAIIDDRLLLTGSFNWTYGSNAENLLVTDEQVLLSGFRSEFDRMVREGATIAQVRNEDLHLFSTLPLFSYPPIQGGDLRKSLSMGAGAWLLRQESYKSAQERMILENKVFFDKKQVLRSYWPRWKIWSKELFERESRYLLADLPPTARRLLQNWTDRVRIGDLMLITQDRQRLTALGVVQSAPESDPSGEYGGSRSVQWLWREEPGKIYLLPGKAPAAELAKYRGSAMRVVWEVLG